MNYLRQKGWSLIERLYWLDSNPAHELSPADAFMQFQQVAKSKTQRILRRLISGGGRITTPSTCSP